MGRARRPARQTPVTCAVSARVITPPWRVTYPPCGGAHSGGAGRTRGGLGQIMEIAGKGDLEFAVNASFDRIANAPKGREGGLLGAPGCYAQQNP